MVESLIFFAIAVIYAVLKIYLDQRFAALEASGEQRRLADLAFACERSEYELFHISGDRWNIAPKKIKQDFKNYVKTGHLPAYVRDLLRNHPDKNDRTYQMLIYSGGRPPYL